MTRSTTSEPWDDLRAGWGYYWRAVSGRYGWRYWIGFALASWVSGFIYGVLKGLALAAWACLR